MQNTPNAAEGARIEAHVPPEAYRFDLNLAQARVESGPAGDDSEFFHRFTFESASEPWPISDGTAQCTWMDGALVMDAQGKASMDSPIMSGVQASSAKAVLIYARVTGAEAFDMAWRGDNNEFDPKNTISIKTVANDSWVLYKVDTTPLKGWATGIENVTQVRFTLPEKSKIEIRSIGFALTVDPTAGKSHGLLDYMIEPRHMVHTLFARTPCSFEYDVKVMPNARLCTGLLQPKQQAIQFKVIVKEGEARTAVFDQKVDTASGVQNIAVDMSAFSGKTVQIRFEAVTDQPGNVAMWSNPVLERVFPVTEARRPINVVWYVIDCLRATNVGAYGYHRDTTPAIDAVARDGARFEWAFSPGTWTVDSVASFLTGLSPNAHGMMREYNKLPESIPMLQEILRQQGYTTVMFAQNPYLEQYTGYLRGFDETYRFRVRDIKSRDASPGNYKLNQNIEEYLGKNRERPFFMYVHSIEPHGPYVPPVHLRVFAQPDGKVDSGDLYDDCILWANINLEYTIGKLREAGLWNNTVLIVTADHGQAFPEWDEGINGHGLAPHLSRVWVPLVMRLPGFIPQGAVFSENVTGLDIPATLFDLLDIPPHPQFGGMSLLSLMDGSKKAEFQQRLVYPTGERRQWQAVVKDRWFFHDNEGKYELIDLHTKPHQSGNVAEAHPEIVKELLEASQRFREEEVAKNEQFSAQAPDVAVVDQGNQEALKALGYIE